MRTGKLLYSGLFSLTEERTARARCAPAHSDLTQPWWKRGEAGVRPRGPIDGVKWPRVDRYVLWRAFTGFVSQPRTFPADSTSTAHSARALPLLSRAPPFLTSEEDVCLIAEMMNPRTSVAGSLRCNPRSRSWPVWSSPWMDAEDRKHLPAPPLRPPPRPLQHHRRT